jgi:hypothetical protein
MSWTGKNPTFPGGGFFTSGIREGTKVVREQGGGDAVEVDKKAAWGGGGAGRGLSGARTA